MKPAFFFTLLTLVSGLASAQPVVLDRAREARESGLPQVVVHDLRVALQKTKDADMRASLAAELGRCLVDAAREDEAIDLLGAEEFAEAPEARFWLAQAYAQAGNFSDALAEYTVLSIDPAFRRRTEATLGRGRMLHALERPDEALEVLLSVAPGSAAGNSARLDAAAILVKLQRQPEAEEVLNSLDDLNRRDDEQRRYLTGLLALDEGKSEQALQIFETLDARNRRTAAAAAIGATEALLRLNRTDDAENLAEAAIDANPRSPLLFEIMAKLGEVYSRQDEPANSELRRWAADKSAPGRAALATYHIARNDERVGRTTRAIIGYQAFLAAHPQHPLRTEATSRLAFLQLESAQLEPAVRSLDGAEDLAENAADRARIQFLRGTANFQAGNYAEASRLFLEAAASPGLERDAAFNSALAAILAGNPESTRADEVLRDSHPTLAAGIELARTFRRAAQGAPDAGRELQRIARDAPTPELRDQANFGLTEWRLARAENRGRDGGRDFHLVANSSIPAEQAGYFRVYAADDGSPAAIPAVIAAAQGYLEENPESPHEAQVRMKWGEVLARRGDYRAARVQFEAAGRAATDRELTSAALFLAARSAARSMDAAMIEQAVLLFDEVARDGGSLAAQARLEQALLKNAAGQTDDAILLLDQLMKETADSRVRLAALLKKGDTVFSLGESDPERWREAAAIWQQVADDPAATPAERNEALAKAGFASVKIGDFDAALSAGYRVLDAPRDTQPEYFWYYRAGSDIGQLLESRGQLREAIAIYEKMAAAEGPRSDEFAQRVKRLRLENFIWEN